MGFALWHQKPLLLCSGTHEYRPMGTAIIGDQGLFEPRDFSQLRDSPARGRDGFIGYFASLNEVNYFLRRKSPARPNKRNSHRILATLT
jgi:hypothetical protein